MQLFHTIVFIPKICDNMLLEDNFYFFLNSPKFKQRILEISSLINISGNHSNLDSDSIYQSYDLLHVGIITWEQGGFGPVPDPGQKVMSKLMSPEHLC